MAYNKGVLESIRTYTKAGTYEVIIVDNLSTDGTREWLEEQSDIKVVLNDENVGFPKGCNIGIATAQANTDILLLNNDIEVTHQWLDNLQIALHSDPQVGAVQGLDAIYFKGALNEKGETLDFRTKDTSAIHQFAIKNNESDAKRWKYTNFLTGYCMLIKRDVLNQIGLLDERFTPGNFEDDDLSYRILAAGYYLLRCHDCFIHHFGSQSFRTNESAYWKLIDVNAQKFVDKWGVHSWKKRQVDERLLRLLEADKEAEMNVLHIGCEMGATLLEVKSLYPLAKLYGIDAKEQHRAVIKNIITTASALSAFEENLFDFVMIGDYFEQIEHPRDFLIQVKKHLKPEGHLILNIQNVMHYSVLQNLLNGHWRYGADTRLNKDNRIFLTADDINIFFNECGYTEPLIFHWYSATNKDEDTFINKLCNLTSKDKAHLYRTFLYTARFKNNQRLDRCQEEEHKRMKHDDETPTPKISAVIPTYQGASYIKGMVDSVLNQTLKEVELIVVIDGSTDDTEKILEAYCETHGNIRWVYQENQGILRAKGRGLKEVTGDYVIFLDHDDHLDPTTFEKLYNTAMSEEADLVNYGFVGIYHGRRFEYPAVINKNKFNMAHSPMWSKLIKTAFLKKHVDYDELPSVSYDEDYIVSILLAIHNPKIAVVDENLYYHTPDDTSTSTQLKAHYLDDIMTSYNFLVSRLKALNLYATYKSHMLTYLLDVKTFVTPRFSPDDAKRLDAFYNEMKQDGIVKKEGKKRFALYLPELTNGYFTIDAGIIPFVMGKHHGYEVAIIAEKGEGHYPYNETYTEKMTVKIASDKEALYRYIAELDILFVFGLYHHNLTIIEAYRKLNPDGKVYCKLDMNEIWLMRIAQNQWWWAKHFWDQCDLITVECKRLQNLIKLYWKIETQYIPNGYYNFWEDDPVDYASKSNTILTVGRPGDYVKHTDLVLNAFANSQHQIPDWKLVMVGQFEPDFEQLVDRLIKEKPSLKGRVVLTGRLTKEEVRQQFKDAKVFCHPSRWEACSNVLAESLGGGCYPIFTDFNGAAGLIKYGQYGTIIPVEDSFALEESLLTVCQDEHLMKATFLKVQEHAKTEINWITLCEKIDKWLTDE